MKVYRGSCLSDFNQCHRKCYWRWFHEPKLEGKESSANLKIGDITHQACHLWYKHASTESAENRLLMINQHLDGLVQKDPETYRPDWVAEARRLITCLAQTYPTETFNILHPEMTIVIQVIPEADVFLQLTVDGIVELVSEVRKERPVMVLEHKTAGQRTGPIITGYLRSPQIISYTWAVRRIGYPVVGGLYNFLVKTKVAEIVRLTTAIGKPLQQRWLKSFLLTVADIERCIESGVWRENLASCHTLYGECPYLPLCTNYTETSLMLYREAEEDQVREEFITVARFDSNQQLITTQQKELV